MIFNIVMMLIYNLLSIMMNAVSTSLMYFTKYIIVILEYLMYHKGTQIMQNVVLLPLK